MHKLVIPGQLPDLNQIIDFAKAHYGEYSRIKKSNTDLIAYYSKRLPNMKRINLEIIWHCENKRKDKDNIAAGIKFILDGLVAAGVIKNDGWGEIDSFSHRFKIDRDNPRIEVLIKEVEE